MYIPHDQILIALVIVYHNCWLGHGEIINLNSLSIFCINRMPNGMFQRKVYNYYAVVSYVRLSDLGILLFIVMFDCDVLLGPGVEL